MDNLFQIGNFSKFPSHTSHLYGIPYLKDLINNLQIKNKSLADWIGRALKEGHKDETEYHQNALDELKTSYERVQRRLDSLYDDKLDGKIEKEFYDRKFKQYSEEKEEAIKSIKNHSDSSKKYFEMGMDIYELSQDAPQLYEQAELDEKRRLISNICENLRLNGKKLNITLSKPFQILYEAVIATNSSKALILANKSPEIFEPGFSNQKGPFGPEIDELLRR